MRVLVTGGTGAVGVNIVRRLAAEGYEVLCLARRADEEDRLRDRFLQPVAARVRLVAGDVGDIEGLRTLFGATRPTHVVHAAAITPTPEMEAAITRAIVEVNLMGTVNVLDAAREVGAARVVFISSAAVYGETDERQPITEDFPLAAQSLYAVAKEASEKLCVLYQSLHRLETISLRVGWVYGPLERPMKGSRASMSLVYQVVRLALAGEEIRLVHLDHVRDWIHADDLAGAVLTLLTQDRLSRSVYNLSGGVGISHRELLETLARVLPLRYAQVANPAEANVPPQVTRKRRGPASIERLLAETSYRPRFTLEAGLRAYVDWVRAEEWEPLSAAQGRTDDSG
ncbi:MAG: NAD(P)-dependent oxidoreductase [Armatimonadota bacterium]|nr:NAD(P)-dependent oxidoreductase [Armatimonadota bacterium]MDR7545642.1 NAD(P)-dependent oxidoreductase [Armatimonadota bacterium]